jgi:hypothetical protein
MIYGTVFVRSRMKLLPADFPFPSYRQEIEARVRKSYTQNRRPFARHNATRRASYEIARHNFTRTEKPRVLRSMRVRPHALALSITGSREQDGAIGTDGQVITLINPSSESINIMLHVIAFSDHSLSCLIELRIICDIP